MKRNVAAALLLAVAVWPALGGARVKDIAYVEGVRSEQLIGYGLVVGLNGTGDTQRSTFTIQSVTSMLKRFGITVPQDDLRLRNVAAVMVTATVPPFTKEGGLCDVVVSSLGDATGLQGGTLLMTPLSSSEGSIYASAQGPVSVGGISVRAGGSEVRRNHTAAGRIPGGAILEKSIDTRFAKDSTITLVMTDADFTTADRIAAAINAKFPDAPATARDGAAIRVTIPPASRTPGKLVEFVSALGLLEVEPDVAAKVVINERTGTIVVGGNVTLLPVAISHGGLNIEIQSVPVISQPNAFSNGQTVSTRMTTVTAGEDSTSVFAFGAAATVQDVAKSLNSMKVAPRDIIAIFQALKEAGALKAELVVM